jgi:hypothetical protein
MSNKKFINRTAFVLAIISLIVTTVVLYQSFTTNYRLESLETRMSHIERHIDSAIQRKLDDMRKNITVDIEAK